MSGFRVRKMSKVEYDRRFRRAPRRNTSPSRPPKKDQDTTVASDFMTADERARIAREDRAF